MKSKYMFRNYLTILFRNILKFKAYAVINILGLAGGLAVTILIYIYVADQLSYDRFHPDADRIYRVTRSWLDDDGIENLALARVAPPIAPLLKNDFPEYIDSYVRMFGGHPMDFRYQDRVFTVEHIYFADTSILDFFSIQRIAGDLNHSIQQINTVIISETLAKNQFGNENPIGKELRMFTPIETQVPMVIGGVFKDWPTNSHIEIEMISNIMTVKPFFDRLFGEDYLTKNWAGNNFATYIKLHPNVNPDALTNVFPDFLNRQLAETYQSAGFDAIENLPSDGNRLHLQPLADIHLYSDLQAELKQNGNIQNVWIFSIIAFMVLIIASINFMNLSTARYMRRAKEVGVRKVVGATRVQLIGQFFGESLSFSFLGLLLALVLVELSLPYLQDFVGADIARSYGLNAEIIVGVFFITLFLGLISGTYPSLYLTHFKPVEVLRQSVQGGVWSIRLRNTLVLFQFFIASILLVSLYMISMQRKMMLEKELGYKEESVVVMEIDEMLRSDFEVFKSDLLRHSSIIQAAYSSLIPTHPLLNSLGGRTLDNDKPEPLDFRLANVDVSYGYMETWGLEIVAGRDFSEDYAADDTASFIINETAVGSFGWGSPQAAVGKTIIYGGKRGNIIGVVRDFIFESMHTPIMPVIFRIDDQFSFMMSVRFHPERKQEMLAHLETIWNKYRPEQPLDYTFQSDNLVDLYREEKQLGNLFYGFSVLAIIIALLGLLGLASYTAEQKTKEIGIRKVFGAPIQVILWLLIRNFSKWVILANIIAWPVAWYVMHIWLQEFAFRIEWTIWPFVISFVISIMMAWISVIYQAVKAAYTNPVEALRYE